MAKLKAHGKEIARWELPSSRIALFEDGHLLRNRGDGWKLYRKLKPGVDVVEAAAHRNALMERKLEACPGWARLIKLLNGAASLRNRGLLLACIDMMPSDPDGVWSECNDSLGLNLTVDDCVELCEALADSELELKAWAELRRQEKMV